MNDDDFIGPNDGTQCVHRGELLGLHDCGCGKRKKTPVYRCAIRGRCTDEEARSVEWCRWCQRFTARSTDRQ